MATEPIKKGGKWRVPETKFVKREKGQYRPGKTARDKGKGKA